MDKTNYPLLSIVAIVAVTAIVAMYVNAQQHPSASVGPTIALTDGSQSGSGLTGNVIANDRATRPVPTTERARPELDWRMYDYNSDGALTDSDTAILEAVVARTRFCPAGKTCDVTGDGFVDDQDKRVYYATVLRLEGERAASHDTLTKTLTPADPTDDELWASTIGAPLQ